MDLDETQEQEVAEQEEAVDVSSEINMDTLTPEQIKFSDESDDSDSETDETDQSEQDSASDSGSDDSSESQDTDEDSSTNNEEEQSDEGGASSDSGDETTSSQDDSAETRESEDIYAKLSEETGVEVDSYEALSSKLAALSKLESKEEPILSPAIQEAIKVEKAGGNLADHFARVGMNLEGMDGKELLRQKFFKDEAKLHGTNPKLAQMKFERQYQEKYGTWASYNAISSEETDRREDFADENGMDNIEYEKLMLDNDVAEAKAELEAWKKEATPVAVQQPNSVGMTDDQALEFAEDYTAQAKKSWEGFEAVNIQMGEGLEDFALGLNEVTKPMVEGWMDNPHTFLQDIGFDGKKIDTDRLLPIMTLIAEASDGNLGGRIAKYAIDSDNVNTIKKELGKTASTASPSVPQDRDEGDLWAQIGEAAEKAREKAR